MKNLVIFGAGDIAELAHFYFSQDKEYKVVGFVVDDSYKKSTTVFGLPLVGTSELLKQFPPESHWAFAAISYNKMNKVREQKYKQLKEMGYKIASYISTKATVLTKEIGENCFILEDNTLQPFSKIGNNVTLWSGNHIGHHSRIKDHCFLASHIVVSGGVVIEENCFIGVNATLRDHITVRRETLIGAGAIILKDTQERELYKTERTKPASITTDQLEKI